ncbi:hypothetical protein [Brachyspira aalborgi]|uniref:Uncharacterized protein n=1 Tax=Brachyspira aalborgi TaxID=29522 RepID=A0A5C8FWA8_9SPIR|nr:hypothetical protein [Brachyspira aalborgi]TXJ53983.1 hypothetical protein EPJ76_11305 [Brachyspira aalborgi]
MTSKTINKIVWWIPFRESRDNVRNYLRFKYLTYIPCLDIGTVKNFRKRIKEDSNFLYKYINLIKNFDYDSFKILNDIVAKVCNYNNIEEEFYFNFYETKELTKFILEYPKKIKK